MKIYLSKNEYRLAFLVALFMPSFAHAHAHAHSMTMTVLDWQSGFSHPLQGLDHIVAMLAVGFWTARSATSRWLLPLTFVSVMSVGALCGTLGISIASVELIILLSGLVLSVLAIKNTRFDNKVNALIVAFFAFFHGYAHGAELASSADFLSYSAGFMSATLLLHGVGMITANVMSFMRPSLTDAA